MRKLLLATTNQGKAREYRQLLAGLPFIMVTLMDEGIALVVPETGRTFEENAKVKAVSYAAESGILTMADDSGLEVDALGGEPGVQSARYAGDNASDSERVAYLLKKLARVPWEKRTAHFRCVIAIATPSKDVTLCHGECRGMIAFGAKGTNGFGYDPIFYFSEYGKTMAELTPEVKNQVSHRARAAHEAYNILSIIEGNKVS